MNNFSKTSQTRLDSCHPDIKRLFSEVLQGRDCSILEGHRVEEIQNELFKQGLSKLEWPDSTHNKVPSLGIDAAPYPINWEDSKNFYFFAGYVLGIADKLNIKIRWGGDWDSDKDLNDQTFMDLVHFELVL